MNEPGPPSEELTKAREIVKKSHKNMWEKKETMKTHHIKENGSVSSCGTITRHGNVTTNEDEVECKSCLNIMGNAEEPNYPPSDEVGPYYWGTCGVKVKFCMAVLSDFMTTAEKKRINKKIAHWYNRFGANIVDEKGKKL